MTNQLARSRVLSRRPPVGVRFIEHTADVGIEVRAPTLAACFVRAAAGMFACFTAPGSPAPASDVLQVEVTGEDLEDLLVAWLEELLYRSEIQGLAFHEFSVSAISKTHVRGSARGVRFGRGTQITGAAVKAVTRHSLEVARQDGSWRARIIFDV